LPSGGSLAFETGRSHVVPTTDRFHQNTSVTSHAKVITSFYGPKSAPTLKWVAATEKAAKLQYIYYAASYSRLLRHEPESQRSLDDKARANTARANASLLRLKLSDGVEVRLLTAAENFTRFQYTGYSRILQVPD